MRPSSPLASRAGALRRVVGSYGFKVRGRPLKIELDVVDCRPATARYDVASRPHRISGSSRFVAR